MRAARLIYYAEGAFVLVIFTRLNVLFHGLRAFIEADEIFRVVRFQEIAGRHRAALRVLCPEEKFVIFICNDTNAAAAKIRAVVFSQIVHPSGRLEQNRTNKRRFALVIYGHYHVAGRAAAGMASDANALRIYIGQAARHFHRGLHAHSRRIQICRRGAVGVSVAVHIHRHYHIAAARVFHREQILHFLVVIPSFHRDDTRSFIFRCSRIWTV